MQNSPGIPLIALLVALALAGVNALSVIAGVGGGVALNELQIGATAWAPQKIHHRFQPGQTEAAI